MFNRFQFTFLRAAKRSGLWFGSPVGEVYCPQSFVGRMLDNVNNPKVVVEKQLWPGKSEILNEVLVIVYVGKPVLNF